MTDEEYLFRTTSSDRKRTARGVYAKKGGARSKKCSLPSDYLTKKEKKELNGKMVTMNLETKYAWKDFKYFNDELKAEYIQHMVDAHGARQVDIAEMLGASYNSFNAYLINHGIKINWRYANCKMQDKWLEYITTPEGDAPEEEVEVEVKPVEVVIEKQKKDMYVATSGTLHYRGDPSIIFGKALNALDPTKKYYITINFEQKIENEDLTDF